MVARSRWWRSKSSLLPILALVPVVCFSWSKNIIQMVWYSAQIYTDGSKLSDCFISFHCFFSVYQVSLDIYICEIIYMWEIYISLLFLKQSALYLVQLEPVVAVRIWLLFCARSMFCVLVQVCLFIMHKNTSVRLFDHHTCTFSCYMGHRKQIPKREPVNLKIQNLWSPALVLFSLLLTLAVRSLLLEQWSFSPVQ